MDGFSITTSVNMQFHIQAWILAVFYEVYGNRQFCNKHSIVSKYLTTVN